MTYIGDTLIAIDVAGLTTSIADALYQALQAAVAPDNVLDCLSVHGITLTTGEYQGVTRLTTKLDFVPFVSEYLGLFNTIQWTSPAERALISEEFNRSAYFLQAGKP